jgi:hypothetical protein
MSSCQNFLDSFCSYNFWSRLHVTAFIISHKNFCHIISSQFLVMSCCYNFLSHLIIKSFHHVSLPQFFVMCHFFKFWSPFVIISFCHIFVSQFFITSHCHNVLSHLSVTIFLKMNKKLTFNYIKKLKKKWNSTFLKCIWIKNALFDYISLACLGHIYLCRKLSNKVPSPPRWQYLSQV